MGVRESHFALTSGVAMRFACLRRRARIDGPHDGFFNRCLHKPHECWRFGGHRLRQKPNFGGLRARSLHFTGQEACVPSNGMSSFVAEPLLTIRIDREPLRFDHSDQWRERPGWRERIKLSEHNPGQRPAG